MPVVSEGRGESPVKWRALGSECPRGFMGERAGPEVGRALQDLRRIQSWDLGGSQGRRRGGHGGQARWVLAIEL